MGAFFVLSCYFKSIFARNLYFDFTPSDGFAATSLDPKEQRAFIYYHFERSEEFPPLTHNPCRWRLPPLPNGPGHPLLTFGQFTLREGDHSENGGGIQQRPALSDSPQAPITYTCGDAIRFAITYTLRVITYYALRHKLRYLRCIK